MGAPMVPTDRRRPDSQFQALVEHAQVGMALIQEDRLLYVNPKYCEIFGYSRNELLAGMTQLELVAGSDRGFVASNMAKLLGGALSGAAFVFRGVRKDGATIDVEAHGAVMKIGDGLAHIVSLMDVSDRQRAAEQMREDAAQIRALLEQPVAAIFVIKDDMTIGYENRRFIELLGYSSEEVIDQPLLDFVAESSREAVASAAQQLFSGSAPTVQLVTAIKRKNGTLVDLLAHGTMATFRGRPAIFGVGMDITERRRAEEARAQLAAIVESSHSAIIGGDRDGICTAWNIGAERVFGYGAREMIGQPIAVLVPVDRHGELGDQIAKVLSGGDIVNHETVRVRKGGQTIDVSETISPIRDSSGRIVGASAIVIDISDRKRAERAVLATTRTIKTLTQANQALVRAASEEGLFKEMCRVIVEFGGYRMAWIGLAQHDADKTVLPVGYAGMETDYLALAKFSWADNEHGEGPVGIAIRSRKVQVSQDIAGNPRMAAWQVEALKRGYASLIALPLLDGESVLGVLSLYESKPNAFGSEEVQLLTELADDLSYGIAALRARTDREEGLRRLERAMEETVQVVASTVEMRDAYTAGHQRRVTKIAEAIAAELGFSDDRIRGLRLAGLVHDLGKVKIPAEILSKPGKLSPIEYELIKSHSQAGYDILKPVQFPWPIADIVLQHHERLDGSGYPKGLKGDAILLEARILAVADVVESMVSHRPYRPALGIDAALAEIQAGSGTLYDPTVVGACLRLFRAGHLTFE